MPDAPEETLSELFARDPLTYTKEDLDRIIQHYRDARREHLATGKGVPAIKPAIDLKGMGIL